MAVINVDFKSRVIGGIGKYFAMLKNRPAKYLPVPDLGAGRKIRFIYGCSGFGAFVFYRLLFVNFLIILLFSCSNSRALFYGTADDNGKTAPITLIKEKNSDRSRASYRLAKKYEAGVKSGHEFFKAEIFQPAGNYVFTVYTSGQEKKISYLTDRKAHTVLYFTVSGPRSIEGFSVEGKEAAALSDDKDDGIYISQVNSIAQGIFFEGYSRGQDVLFQSEDFRQEMKDGKYSYYFTPSGYPGGNPVSRFTINVDTAETRGVLREVMIDFSTPSGSRNIMASVIRGIINITAADLREIRGNDPVNEEMNSFSAAIRNIDSSNAFKTISVSRGGLPQSSLGALEADFGTILDYDMKKWRHEKYELFSWTVFPEFLIIDTIDYDFQNSMFKRLAFFVEKPETSGKLLTDKELDGKHGWNAHDYRAEDLCSFFNLAYQNNFILSPGEELLKVILLENRIATKNGFLMSPVGGGILSISRETTPRLRKVFISHEGYHGVFFSSDEFRKKCESIWELVSPDVKKFWHIFLAHKHYDIKNSYLVINEFMAYNLQQTPENGEGYFFDYIIPALAHNYPARNEFFEMLKENYREEFLDTGRKLEKALLETTGLPAGNLIFLERKNPAAAASPMP